MQEFVAHGYSKAGISRLIGKVGGSRRNIYTYFGGKAGLFAAVVEQLGTHTAADLVTPAAALELPPAQFLDFVARSYLRAALAYEGMALYRLAVREGQEFPVISETLLRSSGHDEIVRNVAGYLKRHLTEGDNAPVELAELFLAMVRGPHFLRKTIDPRVEITDREIDDHAQSVVTLFLKGAGLPAPA